MDIGQVVIRQQCRDTKINFGAVVEWTGAAIGLHYSRRVTDRLAVGVVVVGAAVVVTVLAVVGLEVVLAGAAKDDVGIVVAEDEIVARAAEDSRIPPATAPGVDEFVQGFVLAPLAEDGGRPDDC